MAKEQADARPDTSSRPTGQGEINERGRTTPDRPVQGPRSNTQSSTSGKE